MDALLAIALATRLTTVGSGDDGRATYLTFSSGRALVPFLGSEDPRWFHSAGLAYGKREPRLRFGRHRGDLFLEGYYERSGGHGASQTLPNKTDGYGVMAYGRYRLGKFFVDIGWGLHYVDQRTVDLSTRLLSTPMTSLGYIVHSGSQEFLVGLRYLHLSNAGTDGNNQGANQLGFFAAMRF